MLDCFVKIAPAPRPVVAEERTVDPEEPKFTGFIFKITANIDPNHRSCIAFCKVCSGKFVRNAPYLHVRNGKTVRFSSPTQFMAQRKETIDEAYPGDIVGLPDNGIFKIGDTLTEGEQLHFKGLPSFSPEMFKYIENADPMKTKQLQKGIDQLMDEGVAQLFVNEFNGRKIIGTVGQLQFEVIQYRLENEYGAKCRWEPIHLFKACWIESDDPAELEQFKKRKYQYMAKDREGRDVFLANGTTRLQAHSLPLHQRILIHQRILPPRRRRHSPPPPRTTRTDFLLTRKSVLVLSGRRVRQRPAVWAHRGGRIAHQSAPGLARLTVRRRCP